MDERGGPESQREVQRQIGRCLLRAQQIEKLLKALLAHHRLAAPVSQLDAALRRNAAEYGTDSLGLLVGALFTKLFVVDGQTSPPGADDRKDVREVEVAYRMQITTTADKHAERKEAFRQLVAVRNDIAHHMIDRFDLWSEAGCATALEHLVDSYALIDARFQEVARDGERVGPSAGRNRQTASRLTCGASRMKPRPEGHGLCLCRHRPSYIERATFLCISSPTCIGPRHFQRGAQCHLDAERRPACPRALSHRIEAPTMSIVVYWLHAPEGVHDAQARFEAFPDDALGPALARVESLRREGYLHVSLSTDFAHHVGKPGVAAVEDGRTPDGHAYEWSKAGRAGKTRRR